jgi:hypothetical protein
VVHQVHIGFGGDAADLGMLLAVDDIGFCRGVERRVEQDMLYDVLDLFDLWHGSQTQFMGQGQHAQGQFAGLTVTELSGGLAGFGNCSRNFG